jgi:hypothetical protein
MEKRRTGCGNGCGYGRDADADLYIRSKKNVSFAYSLSWKEEITLYIRIKKKVAAKNDFDERYTVFYQFNSELRRLTNTILLDTRYIC